MKESVFEYDDYKAFLLARIESSANGGRGVRRELAEFIGCQVAYVSHVLAGERHFNLEQVEAASRFFSLREDETEFLFLLLEHQRSGTNELRRNLSKRIEVKRGDYREIQKRIRVHTEISSLDQATYYSSWHYQAIHSLLTIAEFRTADRIASRLQIPSERVVQVLSFLIEKGLAKEAGGIYEPTAKEIHLPRTSPLISKLHGNWRVQSLQSLDRSNADDYHYSGLVTLSEVDMKKVREVMMKALANAVEIVKPSKEEKLCVLAMDFYEL
jgi:uncharacterized protein (TIGR02147 family)